MPINPWGGFQQGTNQLLNVLSTLKEAKERKEENALRNMLLNRQVTLSEGEEQRKQQNEETALIGKLLSSVKDQASYTAARNFYLSRYPKGSTGIPEEYNPQYIELMSRAYGVKPPDRFKSIGAGGLYDIEAERIIPPAEGELKEKWSAPKSGLDESGKAVFFQTNEKGEARILGGVTPEPKKGMKIYDREGNLIVDTGGGTASDISPRVKGELQMDIAYSLEQLARVKAVGESFSKDYLTWYGRAKGTGLRLMSFAGVELSPEQKQFLQGKRVFIEGVEQLFNIYRKDITGAQAVMKELTMLRDSILNKNLAPDEFDASYRRFIEDGERALVIKMDLLEKGFSKEQIGKEIDKTMKEEGRMGTLPTPGKKGGEPVKPSAKPSIDTIEDYREYIKYHFDKGKSPETIMKSINEKAPEEYKQLLRQYLLSLDIKKGQ